MLDKTMRRSVLAAALATFAASLQVASAQSDPVGYQALLASFSAAGLAAPGTGVVVEQVEAPLNQTPPLQYLPDATQSQFRGVTITDLTGSGAVSSHATNVANVFYGSNGYASGITQVDAYEANDWLNNVLQVDNSTGPAPANNPAVANFSWIGSYTASADNNDALRRFDYLIDRDNLVAVVAVNNGAGPIPALLASSYNSIAVGLSNGQSSSGPVPSGVDGAGRSKPDIVAPQGETSYATPEVSAATAMLVQVARSNTALSAGTNAAVVKAILMAGANKNPLPSWSNAAGQPLDPQYGAGQVNFDWAYQILNAGPQTAGSGSLVQATGWSYDSLNPSGASGNTKTYYFQVPSGQPFDLSALLTWERNVAYTAGSGNNSATFTPSLATIDLDLYHANTNFSLGSLVTASTSTIDNVQYVFDRGLTSGEYALQVTRVDALAGPWNYALAWQLQSVPHWSAANSGSWNKYANWTTGFVPNGVTYEADLDAPTTSGLNITLDVPQTIGQLALSNSASSSAGYTITAGSAGTLTFSNSGSNSQLTVTSGSHILAAPVILAGGLTVTPSLGAALDIKGNISGSGGSQSLTIGGPGRLQLDGSNTYSGGTTITAGTLAVSSAVNLGSGGLTFSGSGAGLLDIIGSTAFSSSGTITLSQNGTIQEDDSAGATLSGLISGSGNLAKSGSGLLGLSGTNTYTGATTVTGGTLQALNAGAISDGGLIVAGGGTFLFGFVVPTAQFLASGESLETSGISGSSPAVSSVSARNTPAGLSTPSSPAVSAVPEPDTLLLLLAAGGCGLLWHSRRLRFRG